MKCEICGEKLYYSQEENGLCWSCQQKIETGKCKICDEKLTVFELYGNGMCWWCEQDEKEPEPYTGGMKPRSVFPLMDEFEAEWGVADD